MEDSNILHIFSEYHTLGGVQSVLKRHKELDSQYKLNSRFAIYWEDATASSEGVDCLGFQPNLKINEAKRRFVKASRKLTNPFCIYHTHWGIGFFAASDRSSRRTLMIHGESPGLWKSLAKRSTYLDGLICVNSELQRKASISGLDPSRIFKIDYPIAPLPTSPRRNRQAGDQLKIGFSGRIAVEQKRVDLIPPFCKLLDDEKVNYTLEILGEGPYRPELEKRLNRANTTFHGIKKGQEYWDIISKWDVIIFFSDYEGTPISMLEALAVGVLPIYPMIGTGGDAYVKSISGKFLYQKGNLKEASDGLQFLSNLNPETLNNLQQKARSLTECHSVSNYLESMSNLIRNIAGRNRVSRRFPGKASSALGGLLTFSQMEQACNFARKISNR